MAGYNKTIIRGIHVMENEKVMVFDQTRFVAGLKSGLDQLTESLKSIKKS